MKVLILQLLTSLTATGLITFAVTHMHMAEFYLQWALWMLHWLVALPIAFVTMRWISPWYRGMLERTATSEASYPYYADALKDTSEAIEIKNRYQSRFPRPNPDPDSHPWLFDPFVPPSGWRYDTRYEMWIRQ